MKYILISGGVISGIGKGTISSSTGVLLRSLGYEVTFIKIDPYLNSDAGTIRPSDHGEVFVLDDGSEVDLDLGNYQRFLNIKLTGQHNITTGKIYNRVIQKERKGEYLGSTVQVIPHVTNEIIDWIEKTSIIPVNGDKIPDVCVVELGGTIGDIESAPFVEALRQLSTKTEKSNFCFVHLSYILNIHGELKTKPTQQTIRELGSLGIFADIIIARGKDTLDKNIKEKIALFCHVKSESVISCPDIDNLYKVPLLLKDENYHVSLIKTLQLEKTDFSTDFFGLWKILVKDMNSILSKTEKEKITIGIVGKYTENADSYLSISRAIQHAALTTTQGYKILWIDSEDCKIEILNQCDGIIVPGGFGQRGIEGKITAIHYCRTVNVPFLGICLGMQLAVVEYCRNELNIKDATSQEFDENAKNKVVIHMSEIDPNLKGGNMRLGEKKTMIVFDSKCFNYYDNRLEVNERHRHRFEINPNYQIPIEQKGELSFVGIDSDLKRLEILESKKNNFFVATQFHPEFKSNCFQPHPLFIHFISETVKNKSSKIKKSAIFLSQ